MKIFTNASLAEVQFILQHILPYRKNDVIYIIHYKNEKDPLNDHFYITSKDEGILYSMVVDQDYQFEFTDGIGVPEHVKLGKEFFCPRSGELGFVRHKTRNWIKPKFSTVTERKNYQDYLFDLAWEKYHENLLRR